MSSITLIVHNYFIILRSLVGILLVGRTLARVATKTPKAIKAVDLYKALVRRNEKGGDFSGKAEEFFNSVRPPLTELKYWGGWVQSQYNCRYIKCDQTKLYFPVRSLALLRPLVQHLVDEHTPFGIKFATVPRVDNAIVWVDPSVVSALVDQLQARPDAAILSPFRLDTSHTCKHDYI